MTLAEFAEHLGITLFGSSASGNSKHVAWIAGSARSNACGVKFPLETTMQTCGDARLRNHIDLHRP